MNRRYLWRVTPASGNVYHYQTRRAAEHRAEVLAERGVPSVVERSAPIFWPADTRRPVLVEEQS